MATLFRSNNPFPLPASGRSWESVAEWNSAFLVNSGPPFGQVVVLTNSDGTFTVLAGTDLALDGSGNASGGTVAQVFRLDAFGVVLESISDLPAGYLLTDFQAGIAVGVGGALTGADTIIGGTSSFDVLFGYAGDDVFNPGTAPAVLVGGAGNDTFNLGAAAGADIIVSYALEENPFSKGVIVDLSTGTAIDTWGNTDALNGILNVHGTEFADILIGDGNTNVLEGKGGNDALVGGAGNDTLDGGDDDDTAVYAFASSGVTVDLAIAGPQDTIGDGEDTLFGVENLVGSLHDDHLYGNAGANVLDGLDSDDELSGGTGNDTLLGGNGNDSLSGGDDDDILDGGTGDDTLDGGSGNDLATYALASSGVFVSLSLGGKQDTIGAGIDTLIEIENLEGSQFNDTLVGDAATNTLIGNGGDDFLNGAGGADTHVGGTGNDTYFIDDASDVVIEEGFDSSDWIYSFVSIALLAEQVENLTLLDFGPVDDIDGTGNDLDNLITGNSYNNILFGGLGLDRLVGLEGSDTLDGGEDDKIDRLWGGLGDDTYVVHAGDLVTELLNEGRDLIQSFVSYKLGANVEDLTLQEGAGSINGTGNSLSNTIAGNAEFNVLMGMAGNDWLDGGDGSDTLNGGSGVDTASYEGASSGVVVTLATSKVQDTVSSGLDRLMGIENLAGSAFDDTLTGSNRANTIHGGEGNDTLAGLKGNDTFLTTGVSGPDGDDSIDGGLGNDTYEATNELDDVRINLDVSSHDNSPFSGDGFVNALTAESTSIGVDTLVSIENARGGWGNDFIYGSSGANILEGGSGTDSLFGLGGNDKLYGGQGGDGLVGGAGKDLLYGGIGFETDYFAYTQLSDSGITTATRDMIMDFEDGIDRIHFVHLDAIVGGADDAFTYINVDSSIMPSASFTGTAGELRSYRASTSLIVEADVNGDKKADFSIALYDPAHTIVLTDADFLL